LYLRFAFRFFFLAMPHPKSGEKFMPRLSHPDNKDIDQGPATDIGGGYHRIKFVRRSPLSGKMHEQVMCIIPADLDRWRSGGQLIQNALPYLSNGEREFLMTGIPEIEFDAEFGGDE
jgi:hypothetical protein